MGAICEQKDQDSTREQTDQYIGNANSYLFMCSKMKTEYLPVNA